MLGKEEMEEAANLLEIHSEEYYRVVTFYTFQKNGEICIQVNSCGKPELLKGRS